MRKLEGNRHLGRARSEGKNNIKMDYESMDWLDYDQDRDQRSAVVNTVMKLRVP
jgi:hypothetical protein